MMQNLLSDSDEWEEVAITHPTTKIKLTPLETTVVLYLQLCRLLKLSEFNQDSLLIAMVLSLYPIHYHTMHPSKSNLTKLIEYTRQHFDFNSNQHCFNNNQLYEEIKVKSFSSDGIAILFYLFLNSIGIKSRLNMAIFPFLFSTTQIREYKSHTLWVDAYNPIENKWHYIDPYSGHVDLEVATFEKLICNRCQLSNSRKSLGFVPYVYAIDSSMYISDVTKRYATKYYGKSCKNRIKTIDFISKTCNAEDLQLYTKEQLELEEIALKEPMPKSLSDLQSHPLYCLENNIPKTKSLRINAIPIGLVKGINVYRKSDLDPLLTESKWLKLGKTIKENELPLKTLKRKKRTRSDYEEESFTEMLLYSPMQVTDYPRPLLVNGKIPKNKYGNIEVFHNNMIPLHCKHLPIDNAHQLCHELGIEYAKCVVGFDFIKSGTIPKINGVIVHSKDYSLVMNALESIMINESAEMQVQAELTRQHLLSIKKRQRQVDDYVDSIFNR